MWYVGACSRRDIAREDGIDREALQPVNRLAAQDGLDKKEDGVGEPDIAGALARADIRSAGRFFWVSVLMFPVAKSVSFAA